MESTVATTLGIGDDQDRISQLPDPILHRILAQGTSNMKDVVQTCILSKRWSSLWASMPHLSFDTSCWDNCSGESKPNFSQFVNTVLLLRDSSSVQTFVLIWIDGFERTAYYLATWMKYAVNHNVKEIKIVAEMDKELFELPRCIFTCQSLEGLTLIFLERYVYVPDVINLRWLRVLTLGLFSLSSVSLKALVSGCPILEDMKLFRCMLHDADISSNSLKKLRINRCDIAGSRMRISSPSLHALYLLSNRFDRLEVLLENLSSLAEGYVPIDRCDGCRLEIFHDHVSDPLRFISPGSKGPSENNMSELQTFYNLKKLELHGWDIVKNFHTVSHFLQHSPCLQQLTMISRHIAPEMESGLKKSFNCPHCKIDILAECGVDNEKILALVIDFLNGKCSCFRQDYQPYGMMLVSS